MAKLPYIKYKCTTTHFTGVTLFEAGRVYFFAVDPGSNFSVTTEDPLEYNQARIHIDTDKTLYFPNNVSNFDDWSFPLSQSKQGSNLKPDYDFTNNGYLFPQNNAAEVLYMTDISSHRMKNKRSIIWHPHIHFIQDEEEIPVFEYRMKINAANVVVPDWTSWIPTAGDLEFAYVSGELSQILIFPAFDAQARGFTDIACIVDIQLRRNDNVVTGDVLAKMFDIHVPFDTPLGSGQEFIK